MMFLLSRVIVGRPWRLFSSPDPTRVRVARKRGAFAKVARLSSPSSHISMPRLRNLALAAILVGVVVLPVNQPVTTALRATGADQSHPRIMSEAAALSEAPAPVITTATSTTKPSSVRAGDVAASRMLAGKPDLQREVFGFVNAVNLAKYTMWDFNLLSTVAYFGLHVNSGDGNLVTTDTGYTMFHSSTMGSLISVAHAHGTRVIVSLNLHDFSYDAFSQDCQGLLPANTQNTITQTINEIAST